MAKVITKASQYFPHINWNGQSEIRVSVYRSTTLPFSKSDWQKVLALVAKQNAGIKIYKDITTRFQGIEWLITADEFNTIFLVDVYRHLKGMPDYESPSKLLNPATGNRFHRFGLIGTLVGGIRFWCDGYGSNDYDDESDSGKGLDFGFRFRIEDQDEDEESTRIRAREIVEEAQAQIEMVMDSFMEVAEPTPSQTVQMDNKVTELELA